MKVLVFAVSGVFALFLDAVGDVFHNAKGDAVDRAGRLIQVPRRMQTAGAHQACPALVSSLELATPPLSGISFYRSLGEL